jgi:FkbM family methyltransferase
MRIEQRACDLVPNSPRARVLHALEAVRPFRSPSVRRELRSARDRVLRWRRRLFEAFGDDRYSRPALGDIERKLEPHLPDRGFFVEAGANDGFNQSNTYFLERFRGWRGLLVEPVPDLYRKAMKERPGSRVVNFALVGPDRAGELITVHHAGLMSIVGGACGGAEADQAHLDRAGSLPFAVEQYAVEVPGRTLSALLDDASAPEVDLLSLDLEGYEATALAGLDLRRHAPRHILVEATDAGAVAQIEAQLGSAYELVERLPPNDVLYARKA